MTWASGLLAATLGLAIAQPAVAQPKGEEYGDEEVQALIAKIAISVDVPTGDSDAGVAAPAAMGCYLNFKARNNGSRSILIDGWKLVETSPSPANAGLTGYLTTPRARAWIGTRFPELAGRVFGTYELPPEALDGADVGALHRESEDALGGPFHALYHLASDPGERIDRSAEDPERVRVMLEALDTVDARARAAFRDERAVRIDAATRDELERLGYGGEE